MDELNFIKYLKLNLKIEDSEIAPIVKNLKVKEVKKDEFLLRANEHCNHSFFVEKGLLRQYSIDERGKEHLLSFAPENWFVTDRTSSYFKQPSTYYIQAFEASRVVLIDEKIINYYLRKFRVLLTLTIACYIIILGSYKNA